ncbi:MAG: tRNA lysidine(34) synthetase TilS [Clostridia bacterium]|nr:tRNA lysidine(34) synthetase TilS [Clostridia bacterium]
MSSSLPQRFLRSLRGKKLIRRDERVLVAFSGGKDSLCLLQLLHENRVLLGISLGACHVHHGLRGAEAERDLAFCRNFCAERDLPFYERRVDVPSLCQKAKLGTEEAARILRYEALREVAARHGFTSIAVAHTADDQAETVLFRLLRGSGMQGASAMEERRGDLIRPLLPFTSAEILQFLKDRHLSFTEDSSNSDTVYTRNRIRREILPDLETVHPGATASLIRFAEEARQQNELNRRCAEIWEKQEGVDLTEGRAPLKALSSLAEDDAFSPILHEILTRMCAAEKIVIDFERFNAIKALLKKPCEGKIIEINAGFAFTAKKGELIFGKYEKKPGGIEYRVELRPDQRVTLPTGITLTLASKAPADGRRCLLLPFSSRGTKGCLYARSPQNGDRLLSGGLKKNVRELWRSGGIPCELRSQLPVICDDDGILILPPTAVADRIKGKAEQDLFLIFEGQELIDDITGIPRNTVFYLFEGDYSQI